MYNSLLFVLITEENNQNTFQQQEILKKNTVCACVCTFIEHVFFSPVIVQMWRWFKRLKQWGGWSKSGLRIAICQLRHSNKD